MSGPVEIYCICKKPESPDMIACDVCEEWFHAKCFDIVLSQIVDIQNFPF